MQTCAPVDKQSVTRKQAVKEAVKSIGHEVTLEISPRVRPAPSSLFTDKASPENSWTSCGHVKKTPCTHR